MSEIVSYFFRGLKIGSGSSMFGLSGGMFGEFL